MPMNRIISSSFRNKTFDHNYLQPECWTDTKNHRFGLISILGVVWAFADRVPVINDLFYRCQWSRLYYIYIYSSTVPAVLFSIHIFLFSFLTFHWVLSFGIVVLKLKSSLCAHTRFFWLSPSSFKHIGTVKTKAIRNQFLTIPSNGNTIENFFGG